MRRLSSATGLSIQQWRKLFDWFCVCMQLIEINDTNLLPKKRYELTLNFLEWSIQLAISYDNSLEAQGSLVQQNHGCESPVEVGRTWLRAAYSYYHVSCNNLYPYYQLGFAVQNQLSILVRLRLYVLCFVRAPEFLGEMAKNAFFAQGSAGFLSRLT